MSAVVAMPPVKPGVNHAPGVSPAAPTAVPFHYTQTESFVALLQQLGASLLVRCGLAAVDLRNGEVIAFLEFQTAVEEMFDVQFLHGSRFPEVMGFQKETLHHTFIIPPEDQSAPRP